MPTLSWLRRGAVGVGWTSGTALVGRLLTWAVTLVLAGKLGAGGYGLVSLAWIVYTAALLIRDQTITTTVVYRGEKAASWNRLFWLSLASSVGLAGMAMLAVPALRTWTGQQDAFALVLFLDMALVVSAVGTVPTGVLQSRLRFRTLAMAEIASIAVYCCVALALLSAGLGVVSVGIAQFAGAGVGAASTLVASGFRPTARLHDAPLSGSWKRYGSAALVLSAALFIFTNADTIAVAWQLGGSTLGRYALSFNLAYVCAAMASIVAVKAMMPLMSDLRASGEHLRASFLVGQRYALGFGIAVTATLIVIVPSWIVPVFGASYAGSDMLLRLLAFYGLFSIMANPALTVLRTTGMVRVGALIVGGQVAAILALLLPMVSRYGAIGAAGAATISMLCGTVAMTAIVCSRLSVRPLLLWRSLKPPLLASLLFVPGIVLAAISPDRWLDLAIWLAGLATFTVVLGRPVLQRLRGSPEASSSVRDSVGAP